MNQNKQIELLYEMQQTYALLFSLINKVQVLADQKIEHVTARQHMTLVAVMQLQNQDASLNNIAQLLGTTKQTANQLIQGLSRKGFVVINEGIKDRRSIHVTLSNKGQEVIALTINNSSLFLANLFHGFDVNEIKNLKEMLERLYRFDGNELKGFKKKFMLEDLSFLSDKDSVWEEELLDMFYQQYQGEQTNEDK